MVDLSEGARLLEQWVDSHKNISMAVTHFSAIDLAKWCEANLPALLTALKAAQDATSAARAENERLTASNAAMREALELALEYWAHRQQRYKNRHPVWVQKARATLAASAPDATNASVASATGGK